MELFDVLKVDSEGAERIEPTEGGESVAIVAGVLDCGCGDVGWNIHRGFENSGREPVFFGIGQDLRKAVGGRNEGPTKLPDVEIAVISHEIEMQVFSR